MQKAHLFAIAAALPVALLAGCAANMEPVGTMFELPNHRSTTEINSEMVGTLEFDGKCLFFNRRNNSGTYVPLWPVGTRFDGKIVTLPIADGGNGTAAALGREVKLRGTNEIPIGDQPDPNCPGLSFSVVQIEQ